MAGHHGGNKIGSMAEHKFLESEINSKPGRVNFWDQKLDVKLIELISGIRN